MMLNRMEIKLASKDPRLNSIYFKIKKHKKGADTYYQLHPHYHVENALALPVTIFFSDTIDGDTVEFSHDIQPNETTQLLELPLLKDRHLHFKFKLENYGVSDSLTVKYTALDTKPVLPSFFYIINIILLF